MFRDFARKALALAVGVLVLANTGMPAAWADDNSSHTFEYKGEKYSLESNDRAPEKAYTLDYLFNGYQVVAFGDITMGVHCNGAILAEGDFTMKGSGFSDGYMPGHTALPASFVKGKLDLNYGKYCSRGDAYDNDPLYLGTAKNDVYVQYNKYVLKGGNNGSDTDITYNDVLRPAVYLNDNYYDFEKAKRLTNAASKELLKDAKKLEPTKRENMASIYKVPAGSNVILEDPSLVVDVVGDADQETIINYTGTTVTMNDEQINDSQPSTPDVDPTGNGVGIIYNCPNATKVDLPQWAPIEAHVLAPNADVTKGGGNFAGTIICKSFVTGAEGHMYTYPKTAPELPHPNDEEGKKPETPEEPKLQNEDVAPAALKLNVKKLDKADNKPLDGAVFTITGNGETDAVTTNANGEGELSIKKAGTYTIKETSAPNGYKLDNTEYKFVVVDTTETKVEGNVLKTIHTLSYETTPAAFKNETLTVTNEKNVEDVASTDLKLNLVKTDTNNSNKVVPGAEYTMSSENGSETVITDENGAASFSIKKVGTYTVKETKAPAGYELDPNSYTFEVSESISADTLDAKARSFKKVHTLQFTKKPANFSNGTLSVSDDATTTDVAGEKKWDDSKLDGKKGYERPESVTIELLANGKKVDQTEATASNNWKYSFNNLPEYEDGKKIEYTVKEVKVGGYESSVAGTTITNTAKIKIVEPVDPALIIKKVDSKNNSKVLKGAEFTVTKVGDDSFEPVVLDQTDADGLTRFMIHEAGTFSIKETKAPEGYEIDDTEYQLEVKERVEVEFDEENDLFKEIHTYYFEESSLKNFENGTLTVEDDETPKDEDKPSGDKPSNDKPSDDENKTPDTSDHNNVLPSLVTLLASLEAAVLIIRRRVKAK